MWGQQNVSGPSSVGMAAPPAGSLPRGSSNPRGGSAPRGGSSFRSGSRGREGGASVADELVAEVRYPNSTEPDPAPKNALKRSAISQGAAEKKNASIPAARQNSSHRSQQTPPPCALP